MEVMHFEGVAQGLSVPNSFGRAVEMWHRGKCN